MANRVVINICGEDYTFVAEESAAYMEKVGAYVSGKMQEVLDGAKVGRTDAAVLTAREYYGRAVQGPVRFRAAAQPDQGLSGRGRKGPEPGQRAQA